MQAGDPPHPIPHTPRSRVAGPGTDRGNFYGAGGEVMRQPTKDPLAWWREALLDSRTPRHDGEPQAGFYKRRMVKGGPFLPVEVRLTSVVDDAGELSEPETVTADQMGQKVNAVSIWTHLRPISREEYAALVDQHTLLNFMAATHVRVDLSQTAIGPKGR